MFSAAINTLMPCALHRTVLGVSHIRVYVQAQKVVGGYSNRPALLQRGVQHESTATGADGEASEGTLWDGDLRGWMLVDVWPVVCKQGVRGSSPLSSTFRIT